MTEITYIVAEFVDGREIRLVGPNSPETETSIEYCLVCIVVIDDRSRDTFMGLSIKDEKTQYHLS